LARNYQKQRGKIEPKILLVLRDQEKQRGESIIRTGGEYSLHEKSRQKVDEERKFRRHVLVKNMFSTYSEKTDYRGETNQTESRELNVLPKVVG